MEDAMQDQPYQADTDASAGVDARDAGPAAAPPASSGKVRRVWLEPTTWLRGPSTVSLGPPPLTTLMYLCGWWTTRGQGGRRRHGLGPPRM